MEEKLGFLFKYLSSQKYNFQTFLYFFFQNILISAKVVKVLH